MRLSTKGRYAVMALVDLASNSNGRPVALADISARQEISLSYLEQLFAKLRRSGLVKSVRGPGGGYLLARSAEDTRISDAILAVDEPIRATRCKPNSAAGCHSDKSRCLTHDLWEELSHQIQLFLSAVSLADVCNRRVLGKAMPVERVDGVAPAADKSMADKPATDKPVTDKPVADNATVTNLKSPSLPPAGDPTTVAAE